TIAISVFTFTIPPHAQVLIRLTQKSFKSISSTAKSVLSNIELVGAPSPKSLPLQNQIWTVHWDGWMIQVLSSYKSNPIWRRLICRLSGAIVGYSPNQKSWMTSGAPIFGGLRAPPKPFHIVYTQTRMQLSMVFTHIETIGMLIAV
ncbi:hypothetical protein AMTR_s00097p00066370, partial [Amborella trichopoda]